MGTNSFISLPSLTVGYAATLFMASPADLATLTTLGPLTEGGYANGQMAWCASTQQLFTLQPVVGTADGKTVIATADDDARQWVFFQIAGGTGSRVVVTTPEIDFTQAQTISLLPPVNYHGIAAINAPLAYITQLDGTVSASPTYQVGSNSTMDNIVVSGTTAGFTTQAVNTVVSTTLANVVSPPNVLDFSQFGVRLQITVGAALGSATIFKGRFNYEFALY